MTHETMVLIAKTFGPIWMLGFFLIVTIRAYSPRSRAAHDHAANSILMPDVLEQRE